MYKILQKIPTSTATTDYWAFVKVDSTSTTDFTATTQDELEIKLKSLLATIPSAELQVVEPSTFDIDILFA